MPIVTNPTAGDVHVNRPLTNFAQKYLQSQDMFIGLDAMPNLPVSKQSDLYYEFSRADFYRDEAQERADGTESAGGGFTLSTSPYFAKVYAFHKDVTDRQRANQDELVNLDQSAAQFVNQKLMIRREALFHTAFIGTGIWTTDVTGDPTPGAGEFLHWDNANSDPIADVRLGIETVHGSTGFRPNRMAIGRQAYNDLLDNAAVLDRIKGGATTEIPAQVMRRLLAALFELETIHVSDSVVNSGVQGAAESTAFVASDEALLYYAPASVGPEEPTAGVQMSWTGFLGATANGMRIKRFRHEPTASDRIEGEMAFDYKVVAPELGYFFTNTRT